MKELITTYASPISWKNYKSLNLEPWPERKYSMVDYIERDPRKAKDPKLPDVPFFPTVTEVTVIPESGDPFDEFRLSMVQGYIHTQRVVPNDAGDVMEDLKVIGIPIVGSEIGITVGDKCWVIAEESPEGILSNAQFGIGQEMPTSIPPKLTGGIDEDGLFGQRVWLLCEFIEVEVDNSPEPNTFYNQVVVHRAGIIEHFQPRKVENAVESVNTNEGRVFKESLKDDGTYRLRTIKGVEGVTVREGEDDESDYLFIGTNKHPFKVTGIKPDDQIPNTWHYNVWTGVAGGITIPTTVPDLKVLDNFFIYVKFTRDPYSRAITSVEYKDGVGLPPSNQENQYVLIAKVAEGNVIQHRFEDIRISEFLISEAGELKLISVFDTTNSYALP